MLREHRCRDLTRLLGVITIGLDVFAEVLITSGLAFCRFSARASSIPEVLGKHAPYSVNRPPATGHG